MNLCLVMQYNNKYAHFHYRFSCKDVMPSRYQGLGSHKNVMTALAPQFKEQLEISENYRISKKKSSTSKSFKI